MSSGRTGTRVSAGPSRRAARRRPPGVEEIVGGSPIPRSPYGESGSPSSKHVELDRRHVEHGRDQVVGEGRVAHQPVDDLDLLHQRQPEALRDAALDLALDRERVHRLADVLRGRDLDHPHEPELGVDVDDRAVRGERERHVRVALAELVERLRGAVVVLAGALDAVAGSRRRALASSSRTAMHAACTAPPVMCVWREAEDEPAEPTCVSAGSTSTFCTPSSVRAIWRHHRHEALADLRGRSMNLN